MSVTFENIGNFSVKEVQKWSLRHGLDEYGIPEILKKNDIDGSLLVKLNEETMKSKLNISSFGARHKLITLIKNSTKAQSQARNHSLTIRDFGVGQYLAQIPLLENLSESDRARIGANLSSVNFNSKDVIVKQGQRQLNFYIIREGVARVRVRDSVSGRTRLIARLHPGDFFGEEGLVHQQRAPATIISETAIEVWVVNIKFCRGVLRKSKILKNIPHRMGISAKDPESVTTKAPQNVVRQKSNKAKNLLVETLRKNCIFDHVGKDQIDACVDLMWRIETKKGQLLIKQGDHGDFFYVIESGHFDVLVTDENGFTITAAERGPGASFGELALMYDAARAATVKATEDGVVWVLDRQNFRRILLFSNAKEMQLREKMLRNTTILKYLLPNEISVLASALQAKHFSKGTEIFLQGDKGDSFMIVESGTVSVIKDDKEVNKLSEGKFFGEIALLTGEPRQATVRAFSDDVVCLFLGTNEFKQLLGPIHQLMERNIDKYSEKPVSSPIKAPSSADTDEIVKPRNTSFLENTTSQDLKSITILGSGAFGEVRLVEIDNSDETFALKKVSKSKIASSGQVSHILNERSLMMMMQSPFIVKLYKTFESDKSIYFLMEVCLGGELFTYIRDCGSMEEQDAQFYAGCVVLGFEHMHRQNIIYRDLKPENLMIDGEGYLKITDFGTFRHHRKN